MKERLPFFYHICVCIILCISLLSGCICITADAQDTAAGAADRGGETAAPKILDPVGQTGNYSAILYDDTNGLTASEANAIVQTEDGFLWIGSYSGLVRYDGNTFERIESETGVTGVRSLFVDSRDRLWVGTNDNGLALMGDHGDFRFWGEEDGLGSAKVNTIAEAADGTIYVGTMGVAYISEDLVLHTVDAPPIENAYIEWIQPADDGLMCCLSTEGDYFTIKDGVLLDYIDHSSVSVPGITCILPSPDSPGEFCIGTEGSDLYFGDPGGLPRKEDHIDISPLKEVNRLERIQDRIWILCSNGIGVLDGRTFHYLEDLPLNSTVSDIATDYQGNLWFTSKRQGVMELTAGRFSDLFRRFHLAARVVNCTFMMQGKLFVGTDTGLLVLDEDGPVTETPLSETKTASGVDLAYRDLQDLLSGTRIRSIVSDSKGRLWISTWRGVGLVRYDGEKALVFTEDDGLFSNQIRTVCEAADGTCFVACTGGVNIIKDDLVTSGFGKADGITSPEILTICAAPNGDILLGSNGNGIYILKGNEVRQVYTDEGLPSGVVMRIKYDSARDVFWLVTGSMLAYMDTDYHVTSLTHFLSTNNFDLYENSLGEMWVLGGDGINTALADYLIENYEADLVHYGSRDGLPCGLTSNSCSALTENGDLYLAGTSGVIKVNIDSPPDDFRQLKLSVPFIEADGTKIYPDGTGCFRIPSDTYRLVVYGLVFNYALNDPLVAYRLNGFDPSGSLMRSSVLRPIVYTNLPGGSYEFIMRAVNEHGRGTPLLSVAIVKEKRLREQTWFRYLSGLGLILLTIAATRAYWRRRIASIEKKHKEEAERERVDHELQTARKIQGEMLPDVFPDHDAFAICASMTPAREVGGDFYDFFLVDDDHLALVIADVSDKGIPAALFMTVSKSLLKNQLLSGADPATALQRVNLQLCDQNRSKMFVTVWLAVLELSTGRGTACNAGHENPVLRRAGGTFEMLEYDHDMFVGVRKKAQYHIRDFALDPGDCLFVYTDGVPEAINADTEMFGEERLTQTLNQNADAGPEELIRIVHDAVDRFAGDTPQFDDITMLCMQYRGKGNEGTPSSAQQ